MNTTPVSILNHQFELHPLRALWWPKHSTVVCADVHIGKGAHFRQAGIPIPKQVNASNLWNLVIILQQFKPRHLIFLGDLFHSRSNAEWDELTDCLAQFPGLELTLVKGNHEVESTDAYEQLGFSVREAMSVDGIRFCHEPGEIAANEYTICGHLHPAIRLNGAAQQSLRLPCFWFGTETAVLPAFGEFTGMHTVQPKKGDQVFAIAENRVIPIR
jgi:uncharacterized protein